MRRDRFPEDEQDAGPLRDDRPPRRPWALIAACLVLVVLAAVLWGKWSGTRREAAAQPAISSAPTAGRSGRMAVQPVSDRRSVTWPTWTPGITAAL